MSRKGGGLGEACGAGVKISGFIRAIHIGGLGKDSLFRVGSDRPIPGEGLGAVSERLAEQA